MVGLRIVDCEGEGVGESEDWSFWSEGESGRVWQWACVWCIRVRESEGECGSERVRGYEGL